MNADDISPRNKELWQLRLIDAILQEINSIKNKELTIDKLRISLGRPPEDSIELNVIHDVGDDFLKDLQSIELIDNLGFMIEPVYEEVMVGRKKMKVLVTEVRFATFNCIINNLKNYLNGKKEELFILTENMETIHSKPQLSPIYFDKNSGVGKAHKEFKFYKNRLPYTVFNLLFVNINSPVSRGEILEVMNLLEKEETEGKGSQRIENTLKITALSKLLRKKTGLSPEELVQNAGSLMLCGTKL